MSTALIINTSNNIAVLDSKIIASLCARKFYVDVTPSVYINSGEANILGASVKITSHTGVTIKNYPSSGFDIANDSPIMQSGIEVNIPTQAGNFQYGKYTIDVKMTDEDGTEYVITKVVRICEPDKKNPSRNFGSLSAIARAICKENKIFISVDTPPNYMGMESESQVNLIKLEYPTASELSPITDSPLAAFSAKLYEGVYNITGTVCATYNASDNVYVEVLYKVKKEKNVKCMIDECCIFAKLAELHQQLGEKCNAVDLQNLTSITLDTLRLYKTAVLAAECGEDPSEYIDALEKLLGCKCTCNCNEGTPLVNTNPPKDVIIEENCNVTKQTIGLTDVYTILSKNYFIKVNPNGGCLEMGATSIEGCNITYSLNFDISKVYSQIKNAASNDYAFWGRVINKNLNEIDPTCIGLTIQQWGKMTLPQRFQALINASCISGVCQADFSDITSEAVGHDVIVRWFVIGAYTVDIYMDGVLMGSVLQQNFEFKIKGAADGNYHGFDLIARSQSGNVCSAEGSSFQYYGCPDIAVPVVSLVSVPAGDCPYDLTALVEALPSGIESEWHNQNNTSDGSLVADPENVKDGTYYVFAKNADGCYSLGVKVVLVCSAATNCSAPQNLIVEAITGGFRARFQSAAFAPPSYTVKRKLASDPDVDGSYTTIGSPTYNTTVNRWEILDATPSSNVLYTYKAISNCTSSAPAILYDFANINCPEIIFTPATDSATYDLTPLGGGITKYEVEIFSNDGVSLIKTNTHLPAFSNPTTGIVMYLDPNTPYKYRVSVYIGTYKKVCSFGTFTTANNVIEVSNNSAAAVITNITGVSGYTFPGPLASGEDDIDTHNAFTGVVSVTITGTITEGCLLFYYGDVLQTLDVAGAGTYNFPSTTILITEYIQIVLNDGACA